MDTGIAYEYEASTITEGYSTEDRPRLWSMSPREQLSVKNVTESIYEYEDDPKSTDTNIPATSLLFLEIVSVFEKRLIADFSEIKDVDSIYVEQNQEEIRITVLLSNETYDDALMDALLERELRIREEMPSYFYLDFLYIPLLGYKREERVQTSAKEVYVHKAF